MRAGFSAGVPPDGAFPEVGRWYLRDLTELRRLRSAVRLLVTRSDGSPTRPDAIVDRLLLVANELASNALRHGRGDALVVLGRGDSGWLLVVTDRAVERVPAPAVDRTPGEGGYGLYLVAELAAAVGWYDDGVRKHVWSRVEARSPQDPD